MARLAAMLAAVVAAPALACSVCGVGQESTEGSYLAMTGVLSLLPLAMLGGLAFWLFRRIQAAEAPPLPPRAGVSEPGR